MSNVPAIGLNVRHDLILLFKDIERLSHQLQSVMSAHKNTPHLAYKIPFRSQHEIGKKSICVERLTGMKAFEKGSEAYSSYYLGDDQFPTSTLRLPGLIYIQNMEEVAPLVARCNAKKKELKDLAKSVPSGQRHRLVAQTLPGVVMLQAYRKIALFDEPYRRIVFSWIKRTSSLKVISVDDAQKMVERDIKLKVDSDGELFPDISLSQLKGEQALLSHLDSRESLRFSEPVAPHPRMMVFSGVEKKPKLTYHANLPLITTWRPESLVRELELNMVKKSEVKTRSDKNKKTSLLPRLKIFVMN